MNKYINSREIISRLVQVTGWTKTKIAKDIFGIDLSNLGNRTRSDRLDLYKLINWALHTGVNVGWLLTGKPKSNEAEEKHSFYEDDPETAKLMHMTREIIVSDTSYRAPLKSNIRSYHQAMQAEQRYTDLEDRIRRLENQEGSATNAIPMPDRRLGQRRKKNDPDAIPGKVDRRTNPDRRVAGSKS